MSKIAETPYFTGRRPSIPFAAIGATRTRQTTKLKEGCPCCGAAIDAAKPFVDQNSSTLIYKGYSVKLETIDYRILELLTKRAPGVVAHDSLISHVWSGAREPEDAANSLKVGMCKVRRKLAPLGLSVVNVFSVGYRLVAL